MRVHPIFALLGILSIVAVELAFPVSGLAQVGGPPPAPQDVAAEDDVYLVTFQPGTPAADRAETVARSGAILRRSFSSIDVVSVRVPNEAALAQLRAQGSVLSVVPSLPIMLAVSPAQQGRGGGGGGNGGGGKKPKPPAQLDAVAISSTQIQVSWLPSSDATGYSIERCGQPCNSFETINPSWPDVDYLDSGLSAGSTYGYRVSAFNDAGISRPSDVVEATTAVEGGAGEELPPDAPTNLNANAPDESHVDLTWDDNSTDEDGFTVERCEGIEPCSFSAITSLSANTTSYSDGNVDAGATFSYRVQAYRGNLASEYTNVSEVDVPSGGGGGGSDQIVPSGVMRIGAAPGNLDVTGVGVGVAIVDTGLDFLHPDLNPAPDDPGITSFNAYDIDGSCQDIGGHGTHVGGIVAAQNNLIDVVGVAFGATLYCVNVFTNSVQGLTASDESLIAGLDWILENFDKVDPPIRVANMSLGRPATLADNSQHPLYIVIKKLHDEAGISVAVAAGNDPAVEVPDQVPANHPDVLAVASSTAIDGSNGSLNYPTSCPGEVAIPGTTASYFSTDGAFDGTVGVTISAPGGAQENIGMFLGAFCVVDPVGILSTQWGGGTTRKSGTSMAAPHVAGVLALMWEDAAPGLLDPEIARYRIREYAASKGVAPLHSPVDTYSFDGVHEGILSAPGAVLEIVP